MPVDLESTGPMGMAAEDLLEKVPLDIRDLLEELSVLLGRTHEAAFAPTYAPSLPRTDVYPSTP